MPKHEYTPSEALSLIVSAVVEQIPALEVEIRNAIDEGTVEQTTEQYGANKKSYMKSRQLTDEEAAGVVLKVLNSYLIQVPSCLTSLEESFLKTSIGSGQQRYAPKQEESFDSVGEPKDIEFEVVTATSRTIEQEETIPLARFEISSIESQRENFIRLKKLLEFE